MWFVLVRDGEWWEVLNSQPFHSEIEAKAFLEKEGTCDGPWYAIVSIVEVTKLTSQPTWVKAKPENI